MRAIKYAKFGGHLAKLPPTPERGPRTSPSPSLQLHDSSVDEFEAARPRQKPPGEQARAEPALYVQRPNGAASEEKRAAAPDWGGSAKLCGD